MSWDVWVINSEEKIPMDEIDESRLEDFGNLDSLRKKISSVIPGINWADKTYPHIDNGDYRGHISLSDVKDNRCGSLMFHVYGGDNPTESITKVCRKYNWLALETTMGTYLNLESPDKKGWNRFQEFRKSVLSNIEGVSSDFISEKRKRWWQFWK